MNDLARLDLPINYLTSKRWLIASLLYEQTVRALRRVENQKFVAAFGLSIPVLLAVLRDPDVPATLLLYSRWKR